jgi:hypothetical protein
LDLFKNPIVIHSVSQSFLSSTSPITESFVELNRSSIFLLILFSDQHFSPPFLIMLNINDLIHGDPDDPATRLEGAEESHYDTSSDDHDSPPSNHMEITDPNNMFAALPSYDVNMTDRSSAPGAEKNVEQICSDLQSKLMLDPEHLEIALIGSKVCLSVSLYDLISFNS